MEETRFVDRDLETIQAQIKHLESIDLNSASIDEIQPLIKQLVKGFPIIKSTFPQKMIFRARKTNQADIVASTQNPFSNTSQLWYPPIECITRYGRLNDIGQQIFYCSNNIETAIIEARPEVGDIVTVLECSLKNDRVPIVMLWGMIEYAFTAHPSSDMAAARKNFLKSREDEEKYLAINDFLEKQFTQLIDPGSEYKYKITIAITNWLLGDDFINDDLPLAEGITYESIVYNRGSNLALKPDAADQLYQTTSAQIFYVTNKTSPIDLQAHQITQSISIADNGSIEWDRNLLYANRGIIRGELGDYTGAVQDFTLAIDQGRNDALVFKNRATARGRLGDHAGAETDLSIALQCGGEDADVYIQRGFVRYFQRKYTEANRDCTRAIELGVDDADVYWLRGIVRYYLREYENAKRDLSHAMEKGLPETIALTVYKLLAEINTRQ